MKKKVCSLLLIAITTISLIGCGGDKVTKSGAANSEKRFIDTGDKYDIGVIYNVYYDSKTKIVYLECPNSYGSACFTLIGQNKLPMTVDEYDATK